MEYLGGKVEYLGSGFRFGEVTRYFPSLAFPSFYPFSFHEVHRENFRIGLPQNFIVSPVRSFRAETRQLPDAVRAIFVPDAYSAAQDRALSSSSRAESRWNAPFCIRLRAGGVHHGRMKRFLCHRRTIRY